MHAVEQDFFNDLDKKLWTAANKLLPSLDAAVYKHIVLGLLFIKYVSDAFEERQMELRGQFKRVSGIGCWKRCAGQGGCKLHKLELTVWCGRPRLA